MSIKQEKKCTYQRFQTGNVKNPYDKEILGVGYFGEGKYNYKEHREAYEHWRSRLVSCYDAYRINKYMWYIDCYVCDEWLNFQNFAKWFYENYYEVEGEQMHLDKDILIKNNKIYSPTSCVFVPQRINVLFTKCDNRRGDCPIGVYWCKERGKYRAYCRIIEKKTNKSKKKFLGSFDNKLDAFLTYKTFKENYIKQVADEYKNKIPNKLYDALYNYKVEIND